MKKVELERHVISLDIDEAEFYRRALAGDFSFHLQITPRVLDWLQETGPAVVHGDANKVSNYQHDVGRLILDQALMRYASLGRAAKKLRVPVIKSS